MATTTKAVAPVSKLALFVVGDIKGGKDAHTYRMSLIGNAIKQALQGNWQPMAEAQRLSTGDSQKARAYRAAFTAAGVVQDASAPEYEGNPDVLRKVAYVGKLDAPENAPARKLISERAAVFTEAFSAAFLSTIEADKKAKADERAAAKAAASDAPEAGDKAPAAPAPAGMVVRELGVTESVQTVLMAIKAGTIDADDVAELLTAINAHYAEQAEQAIASATTSATAETVEG